MKNARRRSTPAVIYWEVEKEVLIAREAFFAPSLASREKQLLLPSGSLRLSPFLLTLNVKTRHPAGDTSEHPVGSGATQGILRGEMGEPREKSSRRTCERGQAGYGVDNSDFNCRRNVADVVGEQTLSAESYGGSALIVSKYADAFSRVVPLSRLLVT